MSLFNQSLAKMPNLKKQEVSVMSKSLDTKKGNKKPSLTTKEKKAKKLAKISKKIVSNV